MQQVDSRVFWIGGLAEFSIFKYSEIILGLYRKYTKFLLESDFLMLRFEVAFKSNQGRNNLKLTLESFFNNFLDFSVQLN